MTNKCEKQNGCSKECKEQKDQKLKSDDKRYCGNECNNPCKQPYSRIVNGDRYTNCGYRIRND